MVGVGAEPAETLGTGEGHTDCWSACRGTVLGMGAHCDRSSEKELWLLPPWRPPIAGDDS